MNNNKLSMNKLLSAGGAIVLLAVVYLLVPGASRTYTLSVLNGALVYYVACLGSAVMLGMCGMVSFAAPTFMGVGGYVSAILSKNYGLSTELSMLIAVVVAMLFSLLIGMVLMRLNGTFFTFSTVALVQISYSIFNNWKEVTGGPNGLNMIPPFKLFGQDFATFDKNYYILITVCIVCALAVLRLKDTTLGRAMASVRDNELAAKVMGVNVYKTKVTAFVISAMFAGLAGALMVHNSHFVVSTYFTFDISTTLIIMVMLGGVDNPIGVFMGTILITMLPEWLRPLQEYIRLVYGLGVMLLMVFMPQGLWGTFSSIVKRIMAKRNKDKKTLIGSADAGQEV